MTTDTKQPLSRPIGIIVAMDKELALMLPHMDNRSTTEAEGTTYYCGLIAGRSVVACKCGIGKVNAALGTDALIRLFNPVCVINTGVAGGTGSGAGILDIVVGKEIAYHDVWCGPGTIQGHAAGCPARFTSDARLTALPAVAPSGNLRHGLIASGDIFVSRPQEVTRIKEIYPEVMAVDMESAAIAHACYRHNVPFFCLRVVSDTPGAAENIGQYENFWEDAPRSTFEHVAAMIGQIGEL